MKREEAGESGVSRVLRVLEAFTARTPTLAPAELSRRTGIPLSSTYRLANELVDLGLLMRTRDGLSIGVRLWELAARSSPITSIRNVALPYMEDLQRLLKTHTQLAVLDGTDIVYIERLSARGTSIRNIARIAERMPASLCSSGLLIAAHSTPDVQDSVLAATPPKMTRLTPDSTVDHRALMSRASRQGYLSLDGWILEGVTGVSVPIRDRRNRVVAALNALVATDESPLGVLPALRLAAAGISRSLGWAPPGRRS